MSILFNKILVKPLDLIEHVCYIFGVNKILVILSLINKNLVSQFSTAGTSKIAHSSFGQAFGSLPSLKNQEIGGTQKQDNRDSHGKCADNPCSITKVECPSPLK